MNPFSRTIINGVLDRGHSLPWEYRLFYSRTPNNWLDVGWETDFGWDSDLSAWSIPRTVTDWTGTERDMFTILGEGLFFDAAGNSLVVSGTQILAWIGINQYHVLYHPTRGLAVYDPYSVTDAVIVKAYKFMRQPVYSDIPTVFFNGCDITGSSGFDSGVLGTNPGQWVPDYLGNLVNAGVDVPAMQGMRLDGSVWRDTKLDGTPILPFTFQPTRTFDAGFTTSIPGPTFKRYTRANPATDIPGFLSEPARTNKCTCRKANPINTTGLTKGGDAASVLSVVDDTAALTAAGLIKVCSSGMVYKLDNSAGVSFAYAQLAGVTGNTNPHSISLFVRLGSGTSGRVQWFDTSSGAVTFTNNGYTRVLLSNSTPGASYTTAIRAEAGSIVYFILPQLEEGAFCTSPICKLQDGTDPLTTITRAGTILQFPTLGKIRPNNQAYRMVVVPRATPQGGARILQSTYDGNNYFVISVETTGVKIYKVVSGVAIGLTCTIDSSKPFEFIITQSILGLSIVARSFTTSWQPLATSVTNTSATGKASLPLGLTYIIGNPTQFTGNISELETLDIPLGITDPLTWAKAQWGIN